MLLSSGPAPTRGQQQAPESVPPPGKAALLTRWLLRHRRFVLIAACLIATLGAWRTVSTYAGLRSDLEELLPESAPSAQALRIARERLPGLRHLGVVVETGGVYNVRAAQRFLDDLKQRIEQYPPELARTVRTGIGAEREFAQTYAFQFMDPADVQRLREAVEERRDWEVTRELGLGLDDEEEAAPPLPFDELRTKYEQRFGIEPRGERTEFVSADGGSAALVIQAGSHDTSFEKDVLLLNRVRKDVAALGFPEAYESELRVGYAGDVATRVEETQGLATDLTVSGLVVLLLVVGSVVAYYRSFWAVGILAMPLAFGAFYAFGLVALPPLGITYLNSNTAFLGSIVVGNGINGGVILLARYREERKKGLVVAEALERAVSTTWRATLAAALAASAAYASLIFTQFRGFNQFGWIGGFGLITCWVANYTLIPVLVSFLGERFGLQNRPESPRARSWQRLATARPRLVLGVFAVLGILSVVGIAGRAGDWIEHDFSKLRRRDAGESGEQYWGRRMDAAVGRYLTPTVVMASSAEKARLIEERLQSLAGTARAGGLIGNVYSGARFVNEQQEQSIAEARRLAEVITPRMRAQLSEENRKLLDRALSPQAMQPLASQDLPDALVAGLRELDGRMDRNVLVYPRVGARTWDAAALEGFAKDVRRAAMVDGEQQPIASGLLLSHDITSIMKSDGPRATALSLSSVLLICWFAFRGRRARSTGKSWRFATITGTAGLSAGAVASLLMGVGLMLGVLAWTGGRLNFTNFVALPITFGIAADYAINVLKRYQLDAKLNVASALFSTGGAVALCSLTTIIGFGSLIMAQNRALFSFGTFAIAGEITCLATAVIALPAGIALARELLDRRRAERKTDSVTGSAAYDA